MPEHFTIYIVKHPANQSRETAFAEAMAGDKALQAVGLDPVGGAYAAEGDAVAQAMALVMGGGE